MVSQDTTLLHVLCVSLCEIMYSRTKIDPYLLLVQKIEVEKRTQTKIRIQTEFNKISLNSFILAVVVILSFWVVYFGVEFYLLYRNLEEAFCSKHICLIGMGAIIPNSHIYSVKTSATVLIRHIHSPNRHIHSAETSCPQTDTSIRLKWVVLEQTYPFCWKGCNPPKQTYLFAKHIHPFVYHYQYKIKEFLFFLISFSSCFKPTSNLKSHSFENGIEHVNIPCSSLMEGEHIPTSPEHSEQLVPPKIQLKFFLKTHLDNFKFLTIPNNE